MKFDYSAAHINFVSRPVLNLITWWIFFEIEYGGKFQKENIIECVKYLMRTIDVHLPFWDNNPIHVFYAGEHKNVV